MRFVFLVIDPSPDERFQFRFRANEQGNQEKIGNGYFSKPGNETIFVLLQVKADLQLLLQVGKCVVSE
jgi:hypothetical protein